MNELLFGCIAYLLGSIPTSVWVGKCWYNIDVRDFGSKNAGATNTFRVLGKKPGIGVLIIDILKGFVAVFLPQILFGGTTNGIIQIQLIAAFLVVVGHVFPLFAQFKGGKGVATSLGVVIGIHPAAAGICLLIFLFVFLISNFVSLGAIIAALSFPIVLHFIFHNQSYSLSIFSLILCFAVVFAHRKNIGRLLRGEESRMNLFKK
jgi:acyl phosphate:glycerol-3-phosphate acyltransferase